ncbi:hypothetical protein LB565_27435 [Mesorhizobium sp. CA14]|nr:hypothetical protein [Mesorhizobium sp. CA14]MBZ9851727.1 hypothetical protein [Mesorhizobium sp. CA14]
MSERIFTLVLQPQLSISHDKRNGWAGEKILEVVLPKEAWLKIFYIL